MKNLAIALASVGVLIQTGCGAATQETPEAKTGKVAVDLSAAPSGDYEQEFKHAYIAFSYDHKGLSRPILRWGEWDATLNWNQENPEASTVSVVIDAESIDSGVEEFNGHLKGANFFDIENYPEISFESTEISNIVGNRGTMTGDLTIKDETHPVELGVTFNKAVFDDRKNANLIGFSASGSVQRSQWGLDYAVPVVSDDVEITIEVEFIKPADE
ncbi:MAG: YceI family protein [Marinicaulis sp.]|nr:YceI family protein [Marinicaulis sp.]